LRAGDAGQTSKRDGDEKAFHDGRLSEGEGISDRARIV